MRQIHDTRKVNSIYFDSNDNRMFSDSEEGTLSRRKVRVRWYDEVQSFKLEKKISSVEGRFKTTKLIEKINCVEAVLNYKPVDEVYGILSPSLKVSYERAYFSMSGVRFTFDADITYEHIRLKNKLVHKDPEQVIEIKVPQEISDDFIEAIMPYSTSRFSKYSRGMLIVQ